MMKSRRKENEIHNNWVENVMGSDGIEQRGMSFIILDSFMCTLVGVDPAYTWQQLHFMCFM